MSDQSQESSQKRARLGRGLGSLLSASSTAAPSESKTEPAAALPVAQAQSPTVPPEARIWQIAIDKLHANEYQPRQIFNKEALSELAASIKEQGILQPIVARRHINGTFEIISGERRWRAAQLAGLHQVPVILKAVADKTALELAIIENVQREDLNPIEEAEAYQRLVTEFNLTQQDVAQKVGKERATVANSLRLLLLSPSVRLMLSHGEISAGHAKVLLSLQNPEQQKVLADKVKQEKLSVRALEKLVQQNNNQGTKTSTQTSSLTIAEGTREKLVQALAQDLQKLMGRKVTIDYGANAQGKISISFYSDEELNNIADNLRSAWQKR